METRELGSDGSLVENGKDAVPRVRHRPRPLALPESDARSDPSPRPRWWRDRRRRRMLALADASAAVGVALAFAVAGGASAWWALAAPPAGVFAAKLLGLYDADHRAIRHLTVDELPAIAVWCVTLATACALLAPDAISVTTFALISMAAVVITGALRCLARLTWRRTTPPEATFILGTGEPARAFARKIELFDDMHLELARAGDTADQLVRISGNDDTAMDRVLGGVDRVVLAWSEASPWFVRRLLDHCRRREVKLSVISPFRGRARPALRLSQVADLPVLEYNTWDVPRSTVALKRGVDLIGSCLALVVLAPVFAAVAVAIKLDDRGPVFFRQPRAGRNGQPFTMFKFRSMHVDAERRLPGLVDLDALSEPMFKLRPDPRVTRVGRFLRRYSLDELPQLINVARGEMSLVGPRPEEVSVVNRYQPEHMFRLAVKPGISGPMQVFGRGELSFEERMAVEIDYVENLSVTRDLWLLGQTIPAVIRGTGAF